VSFFFAVRVFLGRVGKEGQVSPQSGLIASIVFRHVLPYASFCLPSTIAALRPFSRCFLWR